MNKTDFSSLQLLAREAEERDRRVMQAIVWLGEQGLLDEPTRETGSEVATSHSSPTIPTVHQEVDTREAAGVKTADDTTAI